MIISDEDLHDACAQCGKRQSGVSNLTEQVFLVNTASKCGHRFCSSCVERELYKKRQFACPRCKNMVSRDKLSKKSLDETEVERDSSIRRKIKALYNKVESDFPTMDEWKNYEEMVEDIVYNLVNLIDVDSTNEAIEQYKAQNSKEILRNQFRKNEQLKELSVSIKVQADAIVAGDVKFQESVKNERLRKKDARQQLNQIMLGEKDPALTQELLERLSGKEGPESKSVKAVEATAPNPVMMFLCQREEPKPLGAKEAAGKIKSNAELRRMHQAGGYDHSSYEKRNWNEMML